MLGRCQKMTISKCLYLLGLISFQIQWSASFTFPLGSQCVSTNQPTPLFRTNQERHSLPTDEIDGDAHTPNSTQNSLMDLFLPSKDCKVNQMSGTDLAYVGDVVFELFIRSRHVWPSKRTSDLQNVVVGIVRAEHQSQMLARLKAEFPLSDKELQILMRGRNAVTRSKNRRNPAAYQDSTSFEALIGYLFINDQPRCTELLNWLDAILAEENV